MSDYRKLKERIDIIQEHLNNDIHKFTTELKLLNKTLEFYRLDKLPDQELQSFQSNLDIMINRLDEINKQEDLDRQNLYKHRYRILKLIEEGTEEYPYPKPKQVYGNTYTLEDRRRIMTKNRTDQEIEEAEAEYALIKKQTNWFKNLLNK